MNEIRPILEKKKEIGNILKSLKLSWIFETFLEKLLLAILVLLGIWKIIDFII